MAQGDVFTRSGFAGLLPDLAPLSTEVKPVKTGPASYLQNFDASTILDNSEFISDIREYRRRRDGAEFDTDQDAIDWFFRDRTWRNLNTISMGRDAIAAATEDPETKRLQANLQRVYDEYPSFWNKGGRGWEALGDILPAVITDPLNLLGFGVGGAVAKSALIAGKGVGTVALKAALRGGAAEGALNAAIGAGQDVILQQRDKELGLQEGFSWSKLGEAAVFSGAVGTAAGALFGPMGGIFAFMRGRRRASEWPGARLEMQDAAIEAFVRGDRAGADTLKTAIQEMDTIYRAQRIGTDSELFSKSYDQGGFERALSEAIDAATPARAPEEAAPAAAPNPSEVLKQRFARLGEEVSDAVNNDVEAKFPERWTALTSAYRNLKAAIDFNEAAITDPTAIEAIQQRALRDKLLNAAMRGEVDLDAALGLDAAGLAGRPPAAAATPADLGLRRVQQPAQPGQPAPLQIGTGAPAALPSAGPFKVGDWIEPSDGYTGGVWGQPAKIIATDTSGGAKLSNGVEVLLDNRWRKTAPPVETNTVPIIGRAAIETAMPPAKAQETVRAEAKKAGLDDADAEKIAKLVAREAKKAEKARAAGKEPKIADTAQKLFERKLVEKDVGRYQRKFGEDVAANPEALREAFRAEYGRTKGDDLFGQYTDLAQRRADRMATVQRKQVEAILKLAKDGKLKLKYAAKTKKKGPFAQGVGPAELSLDQFIAMAEGKIRNSALLKGVDTQTYAEARGMIRSIARRVYESETFFATGMPLKAKIEAVESMFEGAFEAVKLRIEKQREGAGAIGPYGETARMPSTAAVEEAGVPAHMREKGRVGGVSQKVRKRDYNALAQTMAARRMQGRRSLAEVKAEVQTKKLTAPQEFVVASKISRQIEGMQEKQRNSEIRKHSILTKDGQVVRPGETAWYNPKDGKIYSSFTAAGGIRPAAEPAPKSTAPLAPNQQRAFDNLVKEGSSPEDADTLVRKFIPPERPAPKKGDKTEGAPAQESPAPEAVEPTPPEVPAAPPAGAAIETPNPTIPAGAVLAVRNLATGTVNVASPKQMQEGIHWSKIIRKDQPLAWELGFVIPERGEKIGSDTIRARIAFQTADEASTRQPSLLNPAAETRKPLPRAEEVAEDLVTFDLYLRPESDGTPARVLDKPETVTSTVQDGYYLLSKMDEMASTKFAKLSDLDALIAQYRSVADALPLVRFPVATRKEAMAAFERIMAQAAPEEIIVARDFLRRAGEIAPIIESVQEGAAKLRDMGRVSTANNLDRVGNVGGAFMPPTILSQVEDRLMNRVFLKPEVGQVVGRIGVLHHEWAHWAWHNLLTPMDRVEFYEALRKYYPNGDLLDVGKLMEQLSRSGKYVASNVAEIFAHAFEAWMARTGRIPGDDTLFRKIARLISAAVDYLFGKRRENIDPDFDRVFSRLIPDEAVSDSWLRNVGDVPKTEAGKRTFEALKFVEDVRLDLNNALNSHNVKDIYANAESSIRQALRTMRQAGMNLEESAEKLAERLEKGEVIKTAALRQKIETLSKIVDADIKRGFVLPGDVNPIRELESAVGAQRAEVLIRTFDSDPEQIVTLGSHVDGAFVGRAGTYRIVSTENGRFRLEDGAVKYDVSVGDLRAQGYEFVETGVYKMLNESYGGRKADVFDAIKVGHMADDILEEVKSRMRERIASAEASKENPAPVPPRPDSPMEILPEKPAKGAAEMSVVRYKDLDAIIRDLDGIERSNDISMVEQLVKAVYEMKGVGAFRRMFGSNKELRSRIWQLTERLKDDYTTGQRSPDGDYGIRVDPSEWGETEINKFRNDVAELRRLAAEAQVMAARTANRLTRQREYFERRAAIEEKAAISARKDARKTRVENLAKAAAKSEAPERVSEKKPRGSGSSPKIIDDDSLIAEFMQVGIKSERGRQIAQEIVGRLSTRYVNLKFESIPLEIRTATGPALREAFSVAREGGLEEIADAIRAEVFRRMTLAKNKRYFNLADPKLPEVQRALLEEVEFTRGVGLPDTLPANMQSVIAKIMHRSPDRTHQARTMAFRVLSLGGHASGDLPVETFYRLTGNQPNPTASFKPNDPAMRAFRVKVREIATAFNSEKHDPRTPMASLAEMVLRSNNVAERERASIIDGYRAADDFFKDAVSKTGLDEANAATAWFAYHTVARSAGDVNRLMSFVNRDRSPQMPGSLRNFLMEASDRLHERLAYITNGMLVSEKARTVFRSMLDYGDMFAGQQRVSHKLAGNAVTSAVEFVQNRRAPLWRVRERLIRSFTGGSTVPWFHGTPDARWVRDPDAVMLASTHGYHGPGIYVTRSPDAGGVFAFTPTDEAIASMIRRKKPGTPDITEADLKAEVKDLADAIRTLKLYESGRRGGIGNLLGDILSEKEMVDMLRRRIETGNEYLKAHGIEYVPEVIPVFVKKGSPLDLRQGSNWPFSYPKTFALLRSMIDEGFIDPQVMERMTNGMPDDHVFRWRSDPKTGDARHELFDFIALAVAESRGVDTFEVRNISDIAHHAVDALRGVGYDGLVTHGTHGHDKMQYLTHELMVLFGAPPEGQPSHLIGSHQVRHRDATEFNQESVQLWRSIVEPDSVKEAASPDAVVAKTLIENPGKIDVRQSVPIMNAMLDAKGLTPEAKAFAREMFSAIEKPGVPSKTDLETAKGFSFIGSLVNSNAVQLRHANANWIADFIAPREGTGLFERQASVLASKTHPIMTALYSLPDASSRFRTWARRTVPWGRVGKQPDSHDRILDYLRGNKVRLTEQEASVAGLIRKSFDEELRRMKAAGIHVGEIENYVPQIWDVEAIQRNYSRARTALADFFKREATTYGRETLDDASALLKADDTLSTLLNDDGGVLMPRGVKARTRGEDHIDYQRMINLNRTDANGDLIFKQDLEALRPFLENDLTAITTKYFDSTTRRILFESEFGVKNHAFYDYLEVASGGIDAAARLLSTQRLYKKSWRRVDPYGRVDEEATTLKMMVPLEESLAQDVAAQALSRVLAEDPNGAKTLLLNAQPEDLRSPTYEKRVNAIIEAFKDYGGEPGLAAKGADYADDIFQAIQRRPVGGTGYLADKLRSGSKALRAFNGITLLGFTTLTSLSDMALPLIRSGSFSSWAKGLKTYATDSRYREAMRSVGVSLESFVHDRLAHIHGDAGTKLGSAFYNGIGLTPWTNMQRELSAMVGLSYFRSEQARALSAMNKGGVERRAYRESARRLRYFGLDEFVPTPSNPNPPTLGGDGVLAMLNGPNAIPSLREGILKFSNETIFTPNPNDIPLIWQTPLGSLAFQLKSFPLMFQRLAGTVLDEARRGNIKPLAYMLTVGTGFGAAALSVKDVVQMRGGEDQKSADVRERRLMRIAEEYGWKPDIGPKADVFLGWFVESLMHIGGLGLIANLLYDSAAQTDNGSWGFQRTLSTVMGPTVDLASTAFNTVAGVQSMIFDSEANGKDRVMVRGLSSRIPIVGGIRSAREGITDATAGEARSAPRTRGPSFDPDPQREDNPYTSNTKLWNPYVNKGD